MERTKGRVKARLSGRWLGLVLVAGFATGAFAGLEAELGVETRHFSSDGWFDQAQVHASARVELEYAQKWGDDSLVMLGFGRYDVEDDQRSHADVREAVWTHAGSRWEFKFGVSKVFWGVTESRHLVDVINQTDQVEGLDGEDKLGQPMTKLSFEQDWGRVDLFWLPYFRERTFVGEKGRLRGTGLLVDTDQADYASSAKQWHSDFALRYARHLGEYDVALSHFSGTSREPLLQFNGDLADPKLTPYYTTIDQTGIELQRIYEEWLFKLEGITNSGLAGRFSAAVFGFEYTQVGFAGSSADLGWLVEYLFDDRKDAAPHIFEHDVFIGWRYALNDEDSSEFLAGLILDPETEEKLYSLEASRRLNGDLKIKLEATAFDGLRDLPKSPMALFEVDGNRKTLFLQGEDFIQLELIKYF